MKVLVTGGSGYLGTHVREYFNADDYSRRSGLDVLDPEAAVTAAEYDLVIHLAAHLSKSPAEADEVFRTNIDGTVNILKNVRKDAVFVFASTKDVYGRFADNFREVPETCPTLYSGQAALEWSKLIAERFAEYYAHQNEFRACIFRMSTVYAPRSAGNTPNFVGAFAEALDQGETVRLPGNGRPRRDLLHVDDFSAACEVFADSVLRHGLYNLGGGPTNTVTLRGLLRTMEEITGLQAVVDEENPLPDPVPLNYVTDLGRITQELDWKPTISVREGLKSLF